MITDAMKQAADVAYWNWLTDRARASLKEGE